MKRLLWQEASSLFGISEEVIQYHFRSNSDGGTQQGLLVSADRMRVDTQPTNSLNVEVLKLRD